MSNATIHTGAPNDLVINENNNLSRALPFEQRQQDIENRAIDLFLNGQTQPVRAFPTPNGRPSVYIGFTRAAAVALIRKGFTFEAQAGVEYDPKLAALMVTPEPVEGEPAKPSTITIHDEDFPLLYVVDDITAEEAAVRGIADNFQNNKPNDLDLAHAAKALQDKYSYTDAYVTRLLGVTDPFKIGRVKKLLRAPQFIQEAVQSGQLATATALEVLGSSGEARTAATAYVKEALDAGKAPTQAAVRAKIKANGGGSDEGGGSSSKALTGTEIRKFLTVLESEVSQDTDLPPEYAAVVTSMLRWVNGDIVDRTFTRHLDQAFGVKAGTPAGKSGGGRKKTQAPKEEVAAE